MNSLQIIQQLIDNKKFAEAIGMLTEQINDTVAGGDCNDKAEMNFLRGKLLWRIGEHSRAMTDYAYASELDPSSPAIKALEQARDIAGFFNPDLYNP